LLSKEILSSKKPVFLREDSAIFQREKISFGRPAAINAGRMR
jgi:hypothetical protein